jgi:hypothetical protein
MVSGRNSNRRDPQMFGAIRQMAREAGRQPDEIELLVRGQVELTDEAADKGRGDFTGSLEQIAGDIASTRSLGAAELVLDIQFSPEIKGTENILKQLEQLRR